MKPKIAICVGDSDGIGPEIVRKALARKDVLRLAEWRVLGPLTKKERPVQYNRHGLEFVDEALSLYNRGEISGMVTGPLSKSRVGDPRRAPAPNRRGSGAGTPGLTPLLTSSCRMSVTGLTEYLASKTQTKEFAMLMYSKDLCVIPVTRHIALSQVVRELSTDKIYIAIKLAYKAFRDYFGIRAPHIGVCALNPHAGEGGMIGTEEGKIIMPAVKQAQRDFGNIEGPISADAIFTKKFDCIIAMYHDQGLAPFKALAFESGVNVTLGLPFVRTAPDHGPAYTIAGKNKANPGSMIEAMRLCARMCKKGTGYFF